MAIVIPYVKQTWTDGSGGATPVSAARLGVLEEGILDVSQAPAVRVTHSANQSLTTGVTTALAFDTERFDQAGGAASTMHDTVTNNSRLTCRYAGIYQITGNIEWAGNATGERLLEIFFNATDVIARDRAAAVQATVINQTVTCAWSMAVNDFVELRAFQNSGAGLNVDIAAKYSPEFSMFRVA